MVKDHSDREETLPSLHFFKSVARVLLYAPAIIRIIHNMIIVTPVVKHWLEQEIAQWFHHDDYKKIILFMILLFVCL